ncbi:MAG: hypothetical protein MUO38_00210 [Anaerolineales bacterium]|nr:hypothetical protein [Anaerolineales bacterium]
MLLLNPKHHDRFYLDERSRGVLRMTIAFFDGREVYRRGTESEQPQRRPDS